MTKTLKKIISALLVFTMLFALLPALGGSRTSLAEGEAYKAVTAFTAGKQYLIGYLYGETTYILADDYYSSGDNRPNMHLATLSASGDNYQVAIEGGTAAYELTAIASGSGFNLQNSAGQYLIIDIYPEYSTTAGTAYWQYTSQTLKYSSSSYPYLAFVYNNGAPYIDSMSSVNLASNFILYEKVEGAVATSTANPTNTPDSTPVATAEPGTATAYRYEPATVLNDGENYLIGSIYSTERYVVTNMGDASFSNLYPYLIGITETLSGDYLELTLDDTVYGSNIADFEYTAQASGSNWRFLNAASGYLTAATTESGRLAPTFDTTADANSEWTWSGGTSSGTLKNVNWTSSTSYSTYTYLVHAYDSSVNEHYLYSTTSDGSNKDFYFYHKVMGFDVTVAANHATITGNDFVAAGGHAYNATISAHENYSFTGSPVVITMGGVDITASAYDEQTGAVSIPDVTGNIVITANAIGQSYIVTFKNSDGSTLSTQNVPHGSYAAEPTTPTEPETGAYMGNGNFAGWKFNNGTIAVLVSDTPIIADSVFTAIYTAPGNIERYEHTPNRYGLPNSYGYRVTAGNGIAKTIYTPVAVGEAIDPDAVYLIGFVDTDGTVGLLMNQCTIDYYSSNMHYYNNNSNYYAYCAAAVVDADGNVTGVQDRTDDMINCEWLFSDAASGSVASTITSASESGYVLSAYSSSSYTDLYPTESSTVRWHWDAENGTLYSNTSTVKYVAYIDTVGSYSNFFYGVTTAQERITLFKKVVADSVTFDYNIRMGNTTIGDNNVSQELHVVTNVSGGDTYQLSATLSADYLTHVTSTPTITWTASNSNVASIDANGLITLTGNTGECEFSCYASFEYGGVNYKISDHAKITASASAEPAPFTDTDDKDNFPDYPQEGSVRIDKFVSDTNNYYKTGVANVSLSVKGVPAPQPVDVVLIIDLSGSMNNNAVSGELPTGNQTSKLEDAKAAAIQFIEGFVMTDGAYNDNRIGVVTFNEDSTTAIAMQYVTSEAELNTVRNTINGFIAESGTNYDSAFQTAYTQLNTNRIAGRPQYTIFLTDGAPGVYNRGSMGDYSANGTPVDNDFSTKYPSSSYVSSSSSSYFYRYSFNGYATPANTSSSTINYVSSVAEYAQMLSDMWASWVCGTLNMSNVASTGYDYFTLIRRYTSTSINTSNYSDLYVMPAISGVTSGSTTYPDYRYADSMYAARLKGTLTASQASTWDLGSQLDAKVYTIGFGMSSGSSVLTLTSNNVDYKIGLDATQVSNLLNRISSNNGAANVTVDGTTADYAVDAANAVQLNEAFTAISSSLSSAVSDATTRDTVGVNYDVQFKPVYDYDGTTLLKTPAITINSYALDTVTGEHSGEPTIVESVTFNAFDANGLPTSAASSTGASVSCVTAGDVYTLSAKYFTYTKNLTTSEEVFVWKLDIEGAQDLVFDYPVYLLGTFDEDHTTPEGGVQYPTNEVATITYTNYKGVVCEQTFGIPSLPWLSATTSFEYYLVNADGQPVNSSGEVIRFADRVIVGRDSIVLPYNVNRTVYAAEFKPAGYVLFSGNTHYTVYANSGDGGATGSMTLYDTGTTSGGTSVNTTRVSLPAGSVSTLQGSGTYSVTLPQGGYNNTTVSFAVVINAVDTELDFQLLGAQAHIVHKTMDNKQPMFTNGIRFAVKVNFKSLQQTLNIGDYFNLGMMMLPANRLMEEDFSLAPIVPGGQSANNSNLNNMLLMRMSIDGAGKMTTFPTQTSSVTGNSAQPATVFFSGATHQIDAALTMSTNNMIRWSSALDTEADKDAFTQQLVATALNQGLNVKILTTALDEGTDYFTYMVYINFAGYGIPGSAARLAQADREIAYRGVFVKLAATAGVYDDFDIQYTYQRMNSATRVFRHYFYEGAQNGSWSMDVWLKNSEGNYTEGTLPTEADLNGWSLYAPPIATQNME